LLLLLVAFVLVAGVMALAPAGWRSPWWEVLAALFAWVPHSCSTSSR
jgi:hypothetical protein